MSENVNSPLLNAIEEHSYHAPHKIALIEDEYVVTYEQLWQNILFEAEKLSRQGFKHGDRLLLQATKEKEFVYRYFGAHMAGVVAVVVDPTSPKERIDYIKKIISLKGTVNDDTADLMFTTGTTGVPKGVCLSHANISGSADNINSFIGNTADDVEVLALPLSHSFGLGRLRCVLKKGGTIVLLGNFANLKLFFNALEKYSATGFGMVPAAWQYIHRFSGTRISRFAPQLRYIEIGSAAMSIEDKKLLSELFPNTRICMHYGLTEASRSFFMEFHDYADNLQTIGLPASSIVDARIMDDNGHEIEIGKQGEICVSGNMVMQSYYLPEDNRDAFWKDYFRTGDWGYKDSKGLFYLTGRQKELINIGGNKISPSLIEEAVLNLGLGISDCACVAIPDPNGILGEVPKVFMVKGNYKGDVEKVRELLSNILEPYQLPVEYVWTDFIPKTSSGKIQRLLLKQK